MRALRRILVSVAVVAVLAYAAVLAGMFLLQREFQYDRSGRMFDLAETALQGAELVAIPTADGSPLAAWYQAPAAGKPLILYFRGNSQSFSREHERYAAFVADGYGFVAFDYRGFPGSPGELNEANVLADGLAVYDWAAAKGFPIVLWGRSLGSGPATYVASQREADAMLLETPFDSAVAVAAERYGFLPVYVAHGTADETIGVQHGERVFALAPNRDELWIEPGGTHSDLWERGLWGRAEAFFGRAEAAK